MMLRFGVVSVGLGGAKVWLGTRIEDLLMLGGF